MTDQDVKSRAMDANACSQAEPHKAEDKERRVAERSTERQVPLQALVEQCRYFEAFFQYAITPMALLDRDFNFIRVNQAYAKADQKDVDEFPGHNHFEFYPSDAKEIFEEVVRTRQPFRVAARPFVYADHPERGVTYWDWTLTPLLDENGEVEVLVFALEDVTMRIRTQIELEQQQKHLEEMVRERTRELEATNARLQAEIAERTEAERKLALSGVLPGTESKPDHGGGPGRIHSLCQPGGTQSLPKPARTRIGASLADGLGGGYASLP